MSQKDLQSLTDVLQHPVIIRSFKTEFFVRKYSLLSFYKKWKEFTSWFYYFFPCHSGAEELQSLTRKGLLVDLGLKVCNSSAPLHAASCKPHKSKNILSKTESDISDCSTFNNVENRIRHQIIFICLRLLGRPKFSGWLQPIDVF